MEACKLIIDTSSDILGKRSDIQTIYNEQKMTECICACVYMFLRACKRRYKKTRDANLQARAKLVR